MTSNVASTRVLAIDLRQMGTGALLGVALVVPSERYLAILTDRADRAEEPELTAHAWREIDAWAVAGDAALPARPAPMSSTVVAALLERECPSVIAQRFASIPVSVTSHTELAPLAARVLPELLKARGSAA